MSRPARIAIGTGCIVLGCFPIALGLGLLPADEPLSSPPWVVAGAGVAFVIAGLMIMLASHARANDFLAGVLLLIFGLIGLWVSFFSSSEGFSGGLLLLSRESNVALGRWIFGFGSLISLALSVYAFRRALRNDS